MRITSVLISMLLVVGCDSTIQKESPVIQTDAERPFAGIRPDAELKGLLKQVVPYTVTGPKMLEPEKRFLFNLNKLINEDLAAQSEAYKLAVCKLALRQALAITPTVDSIEVRRNPFYSGTKPPNETVWALGGDVEESSLWRQDCDNTFSDSTTLLFTLKEGKITKVNVTAIVVSCGGKFSDCCSQSADPPHLDEAWYQNFVDLGREADFPTSASEYPISAVKKLAETGIKTLDLRYSRISPTGISNLALLQSLEDLSIAPKTPQHTEAAFDLLRKLPHLKEVRIESGLVSETQMRKLSECTKLTRLILTRFRAEEPAVLEPINRMKSLEFLSIGSMKDEPVLTKDTLFRTGGIFGYHYGGTGFLGKDLAFHDLPNLRHFAYMGLENNTLSLSDLPMLTTCITDAGNLAGDFFTDRMPKDLETLYGRCAKTTREQMQALASLGRLETLYLTCRQPEGPTVFEPLAEMKSLKTLSLMVGDDYPRNVFENFELTLSPPNLSSLAVRMSSRTKLRLPELEKKYDLALNNIEVVGEMPQSPGRVEMNLAKMSYEQFQVFKDGSDVKEGFFRFDDLILTELDSPDLLLGFRFPFRFSINFQRDEMKTALKGKTFHFENCDRLRYLNVGVIDLKETNVRPLNLPKLRECKITTNVYE